MADLFGIVLRTALTAKANGVEPGAYIQHILENIGTADTVEKLEALLPWNAKVNLP